MKQARIYHAREKATPRHRKYLDGRDVGRYAIDWSGAYLHYGNNLAAPRDADLFEGERILVRQIPSRMPFAINAALVSGRELNDLNSMIVRSTGEYSNLYLLALLNSRLLSFWFDVTYDKFQRGIFPQFKINELAEFPMCALDLTRSTDRTKYEELIRKATALMNAKTELANASTDKLINFYTGKVVSTDRQIDSLVYALYSLSAEEIDAVERAGERLIESIPPAAE